MKSLLLAFSTLFLFYGCHVNEPHDNVVTSKVIVKEGIEYSLGIPTNVFSLYDTLSISFLVANRTISAKHFYFSNLQELGFQLLNRNNEKVLIDPTIVLPACTSFTLERGETKLFETRSIFKDFHGNYIDKGEYTLSVFLLDNNSPALNLSISVK